MDYGLFTMPSHPPERTLFDGHQWDLQQLRWADELGFSEAWIGEHHTAPWEPHPAPDLLVAQALMQTKRMRIGPGGFLMPYHHPAELANRVAMLDHLAQGRLNFGVAASGLVFIAWGWVMPRKTWAGVQILALVRGFQEFLERAEKDRLERMPPDTLHRWLPWAMALGVTERWVFNFQGLKVAAPTWYQSRGDFSLPTFVHDLGAFARRAEEAILTTRRGYGDGGGGRGGGGFSRGSSGGGMGGGGGGTF